MPGDYAKAGPQVTVLDPQDYADGVIRVRVKGDTADRLQIHLDGSLYAGNGTDAPALLDTDAAAVAADLTAHEEDTTAAHAASAVSVDDTAFSTLEGTDLQTILAAIDAALTPEP